MTDLHKNCLHTTRPDMTPRERADKCGCITMIGLKYAVNVESIKRVKIWCVIGNGYNM